jgi:hypothetical protein
MKKLLFIIIAIAFSLKACSQDQSFDKIVTFKAGFILNGKIYLDIPTGGTADWNTLLNKPLVFPSAPHNHALDYKSINYVPAWDEITGKPEIVQLSVAIEELGYLPIPSKTTMEISLLTIPLGKRGMVFDKTLNVYKLYDGTTWNKIVITSQ